MLGNDDGGPLGCSDCDGNSSACPMNKYVIDLSYTPVVGFCQPFWHSFRLDY